MLKEDNPKPMSPASAWNLASRKSIEQVEEGKDLAPKFSENNTLPCITQHAETGEILMFAYMNEEALRLTIENRLAHYWSRSRQKLWFKGETSGMYQQVQQILIDDDQDCVIIRVTLTPPTVGGNEASCHVGYRSCFYREIQIGESGPQLQFIDGEKAFNPKTVYEGTENPTKL
jgi:phosphoribosyl-AMP cyclohydrolase